MTKEIFADTVGRVDFSGGVVRVDLVSMEPMPNGNDEAEMAIRQRVVMPLDGFLNAFSAIGEMVQKLVDAKVIVRDDDGKHAADVPASAEALAEMGPKSPNFTN